MGGQIEAIKDKVHARLLALRSIDALLSSEKFRVVQDKVNIDSVRDMINRFANVQLADYIDSFFQEGELSLRQLRREARQLGIRYYTKLTKQQLLGAIHDCKRSKNDPVELPLDKQR